MTNHDSDGLFEGDAEERSELAWTEQDWERYLAAQTQAVRTYAAHYDKLGAAPDRIDQVARLMGWETAEQDAADRPIEEEAADAEFSDDWEPYTTQCNPVYIASHALQSQLATEWEKTAAAIASLPAPAALRVQAALHLQQTHSLHAIQALEMGDYILAVCFFKRALRALNETLAALESAGPGRELADFRLWARPRLFDLREIWLRVMAECRVESDGD
jgi:hypothetical protein